jgi:hypothetical protein
LRGWNLAAQAEGGAYVIKSKLRGIALHVRYRPRGLSMAGDMWCGIDGVVSNALGTDFGMGGGWDGWEDGKRGVPDNNNNDRRRDFTRRRRLCTEEGRDLQYGGTGMGRS